MKKKKLICLCAALCITVMTFLSLFATADFGSYSGNSDYGGSDYGSSDYGSSDYDYDYGGGYYSTYSDDDTDSDGSFGIYAIVILGIIIYCIVAGNKKGKITPNVNTQTTNMSSLIPIEKYIEVDANFDPSKLKDKISNLYVKMQNCWTQKNIEELRPYFTDALYNQFSSQLESMKKAGRTNYVEQIAVLGVDILGYKTDDKNDYIYLNINTRIVDYTVSDLTGEVVSGSKTAEKFMKYEYELSRPCGFKTPETEAERSVTCPHCGAAVSINESAKCPYCGSVIEVSEHDFVINSIKGISQQTK